MLTPFAAADRGKAIRAALTLLGSEGETFDLEVSGSDAGAIGSGLVRRQAPNEQAYFAMKKPRTKIEELAVAARYREERESAQSSTKSDLAGVFRNGRVNFDAGNYRRDLENARAAGFFTRGTGKDSATLTGHGQNYVDALPDREAATRLAKPKRAKRKKAKRSR